MRSCWVSDTASLVACPSLQAWRGPLLQHLHLKHQRQASADALATHHLLARCLARWQAAVAASRQEQARLTAALQLRRQRLLRQGLEGLQLVVREAQQERQVLAAAAGPAIRVLSRLRQRWVLRAWLTATRQQQHDQQLVSTAEVDTGLACMAIGILDLHQSALHGSIYVQRMSPRVAAQLLTHALWQHLRMLLGVCMPSGSSTYNIMTQPMLAAALLCVTSWY